VLRVPVGERALAISVVTTGDAGQLGKLAQLLAGACLDHGRRRRTGRAPGLGDQPRSLAHLPACGLVTGW